MAQSQARPLVQLHTLEEVTARDEDVTLMVCVGALTRVDAGRLHDQLRVQLRHGPRHLLLDLSEVSDIDHVAVAVIVDVHRRARSAQRTFFIVAPSAAVVARLRLTRLDRLLTVHVDLVAALTALDAS